MTQTPTVAWHILIYVCLGAPWPGVHEPSEHENEPLGGTHFHMNGFAQRLVLTQRQKPTRKWHVELANIFTHVKN